MNTSSYAGYPSRQARRRWAAFFAVLRFSRNAAFKATFGREAPMQHLRAILLCLLALGVSPMPVSGATGSKDDDLRQLAARVYANCLDSEGARILAGKVIVKPTSYEKTASAQCAEHEGRLRTALRLDMLQAQVQRRQRLGKEAESVILEAIEQVITNIRRIMVILYAQSFDKQYPGIRSCSMESETSKNEKVEYFCAVRD